MRARWCFAVAVLWLASCRCDCPPTERDAGATPDLDTLASDLSAPAVSSDLACLACDAVLNPCPPLKLVCDPIARCCAKAL